MRGGCLDCGVPVSAQHVRRCRACNGRRMRERHRKMRALRAGVFSVNARAAVRLAKRMDGVGGVGGGGIDRDSPTGRLSRKSRELVANPAPPLDRKECA